jgi:hypothetical protein
MYYYICVLILLILLYTTTYVFAYCCIRARRQTMRCSLTRHHSHTRPTQVRPLVLLHVSSYCCICFLILLHRCPHTAIYVASSYCMCVLILLYMCAHTSRVISRIHGLRMRASACASNRVVCSLPHAPLIAHAVPHAPLIESYAEARVLYVSAY